ncbi:MAG TPA: hypothetical protein VK968_18500, partial [Roseimicrobium sp.]|nr:hypothetical protein [Roseimicrobium sp.]
MFAFAVLLLAGCKTTTPVALYFSSPEDSVVRCTALMRSQNWSELAKYYDLTGSGVDRRDLESGTFFLRTNPPEMAHPGGLWKFREPFAPGFNFVSAELAGAPDIVAVIVGIAIDEGGGLIQRGRTTFHLKRSTHGYQLLPAVAAGSKKSATDDPAYALTGGISRVEAAWRAGVEDADGSWHGIYSAELTTWFFTSAKGAPVALQRVPVANPALPQKAPPGFEPKPWQWTPRKLPAMDVIASDELGREAGGSTRMKLAPATFTDLFPELTAGRDVINVPKEKLWPVLDR